jgi:hypothetical protein
MRLWITWALILVATEVEGAETVCLNPGGNAAAIFRAEGIAARILKNAVVALTFKDNDHVCAGLPGAIVIHLSYETPADNHPGALAYSTAFEGTQVVVFYDRVMSVVRPSVVPFLLGHVLAHEIVHLLEGVEVHSESGVMKSRYDSEL